MIRIAVIQDPHSNSGHKIIQALAYAGMQAEIIVGNEPQERLADFHGFVIAGLAASSALNPVIQDIIEQSMLGKPVLGIGKGAQILVETGLVPGLERNQVGMALAVNQRAEQTGFYEGRLHIRLSKGYQWNVFTRHWLPEKIMHVHVTATEGRFIIPPVLLAEVERNGLHVFQYCNEDGHIVDDFSVNPLGSIHNIAAISNKTGNVMAILPDIQCTPEANAIFASMREYVMNGYVAKVMTLDYQPRYYLGELASNSV